MLNFRLGSVLVALSIFSVSSITLTTLNANIWPLSAYNVFYFVPPAVTTEVEIRLTDEKGKTTTVPPGRVLPIEFFAARSTMVEVYLKGEDLQLQTNLARMILKELNTKPWGPFDETMKAARQSGDPLFLSLAIDIVRRDYHQKGESFGKVLDRTEVFEYRTQ